MRLLIDSNVDNNLITGYLLDGTNDIVTARALDKAGIDSEAMFKLAQELERVLVCFSNKQYAKLHRDNKNHQGIIRVHSGPKEVGPHLREFLKNPPKPPFCVTITSNGLAKGDET